MKIICVQNNYRKEAMEPEIYLRPDSSLLKENKPFYIPDFTSEVTYRAELVYRVCRLGKNIKKKFAGRYYDAVAVGVSLCADDLRRKLKAEGKTTDLATAFDGSAVLSGFKPMEDMDGNAIEFVLTKNGEEKVKAESDEAVFGIDDIIEYVSKFYTLKIGDYIYMGGPDTNDKVQIEDRLTVTMNGEKMIEMKIK